MARVIKNNTVDLNAYPRMTDLPVLPCAIIEPADADFEVTMSRGTDCWYLNIFVMCSRQDTETGQDDLDEYISGSGAQSIREILYNNDDLGLPDTEVIVVGMAGYGGSFQANRVSMVGAMLKVKVFTSGRA